MGCYTCRHPQAPSPSGSLRSSLCRSSLAGGGGGGRGRPQPPSFRSGRGGGRDLGGRGFDGRGLDGRGLDGRPPSHVFNKEEYRQTNSGLYIPTPRDRSNEPVPVPGSQDLLGLENDPEAQALASSMITIKPPAEVDEDDQCSSDEERIMTLQRRAGPWYKLAALLPALRKSGFDSTTIDATTRIGGLEQDRLSGAYAVYKTLKNSDRVREEVLRHYEQEGGAEVLYTMRDLHNDIRSAVAEYAAEKSLNVGDCVALVRAVKEMNKQIETGGQYTEDFDRLQPGDVLAFDICRQIQPTVIKHPELERLGRRALSLAVTRRAKMAILRIVKEGGLTAENLGVQNEEWAWSAGQYADSPDADGPSAGQVPFPLTRLEQEEREFKMVPFLGIFNNLTEATIRSVQDSLDAPRPFAIFNIQSAGKFVVLPSFSRLEMQGRNVFATYLEDKRLLPLSRSQTQMDLAKEPALLLCSKMVEDRRVQDIAESSFYLCPESGQIVIQSGMEILEKTGTFDPNARIPVAGEVIAALLQPKGGPSKVIEFSVPS